MSGSEDLSIENRTMLQRLIWKDATMVKPLVWAAFAVVAVLNLCLFFLWQNNEVTNRSFVEFSIALWILVPQLVAFGAPAMLVGTEEEQGTLHWLRTLPVHWRSIVNSKLAVGFAATAATWLVSSVVIFLFSFGWTENVSRSLLDMVSPSGIVLVLLNSAILLMLGFMLAYWIRSPLIALLTLVLVYTFISITYITFTDWMEWNRGWYEFSIVLAVGIAVIAVAWGLQSVFARQRLLLPSETTRFNHRGDLPVYTYRPPVSIASRRPTEVASLLWQQIRQTAPLCISLLGMANLFILAFCISNPGGVLNGPVRTLGFFSVPFVVLCGSWLGASVFYGDTIRHRCGFFADRGISPTRIWLTRMAPPAVACGILLLSMSLLWFNLSRDEFRQIWGAPWQFMVLIIVLFAFGQLVSQWTERPLLAFFAAPAYAFMCLMPIFYAIERFNSSFLLLILTAPVLLVATWRQTGRWLEGRKRQYAARVIGYTAAAILLPILLIPIQFFLPNVARFAVSVKQAPMDPQTLAHAAPFVVHAVDNQVQGFTP